MHFAFFIIIYYNVHLIYAHNNMKRTKKGYAKVKVKKTKKAKTKQAKKGGMFRQSASKAAKEVFGKVFGETWPERVDRLNQMKDAALKGANAAKKGAENLSSSSKPKTFSSPSSNMRLIGNPFSSPNNHKHNDDENPNYKTPTKSTSTREPILLSNRLKNDEPVEQRARRLGLSVAPTLQHPIPIVAKLFDEDGDEDGGPI